MGLDELFKYIENEFTPHGHCYLWKPVLVWLMASSDLLIFLSYMAIPVILGIFYYRSNKKFLLIGSLSRLDFLLFYVALLTSWKFGIFGIPVIGLLDI